MTDRYASGAGLLNPAVGGEAVTPDTPFSETCRALYVGSDGALVVAMKEGTTLTFASVRAGDILPIRATMVVATGTTAADLIALY